ncbi:MAG: hypothetical protein JSV49_04775 [Thermoplasmata archaeon]|nr:MAG: hypothetical protein JSV49_04775 [Thermoplasmata archaeon]
MLCTYCGNEVDDGTFICPYCDQPVPEGEVFDPKAQYASDQVFTVEEWQKQRTVEKRDSIKTDHDDMERRVEEKKRIIEEKRRDSGLDMIEDDPERFADDNRPNPRPRKGRPSLEELLEIVTKDKKKEVLEKFERERQLARQKK